MNPRKSFVILVGLLVALLLISACGTQASPQTAAESVVTQIVEKEVTTVVEVEKTTVVEKEVVVTATPEPAGPVTITFWHGYNDVETKMLEEQVIPAFEAQFPNIKVDAQAVPYDEFRKKLLTSMAGGTAPDLIRADIAWVPEFAELGALARLDEVMPDFDDYAGKVFPGPLSTNLWKGNYYGLPLDTNTRLLLWNKQMYEAAGLSEPPATIEEFQAACEQIATLGSDVSCFADGGTYGWAVLPWVWSFGGDITDADMTTATGYVNGEQTVAAYEFLKQLLDAGSLNPGILGGGIDTAGGYANDQIANLLEGPWMPPIFEAQYPEKELNWALMPAGEGGSISVVGGEDIVMFQQSRNKEAAAEFIRFMLSPEAQLMMAEAGQVPVRTDITEAAVEMQPYFALFFEQLETAKARLPHPNWPKIEDLLTSTGQMILRGEKSAQEALDELAPQIDSLLVVE